MTTDTASTALPAGVSGPAFASVFQAVHGLRNRPAILAMLGCTFVGVLVAGLLFAMAGTLGFIAPLLAGLVWLVAVGTGVNAAGLLQMDHARGLPPRSIADALVYGLMCIPKLIVLVLALIAVEIAVFIGLALLLLICKLPFLGPLLFVIVFPVSVVIAGITVTGLFICMVLSLPAIWQGASITRALGQTLAIVKSRLVETVLLLFFLGFLCFAVGMIVFGVLGAGMLPTVGMSMSIVGVGGAGFNPMAMAQGAGGGHAIAAMIGGFLLWAVAGSLVGQVYLAGLSLVYLRVTEGLDLSASEASLRATFDDAKRRTAELGEKARSAATRDAPAAAAAGAAVAPAPFVPEPFVAPAAPVYNPPPAFVAAPTPFAAPTAPFAAVPPDDATRPPQPTTAAPADGADIALPFDDAPPPAPSPAYGAPPAWKPPPTVAAPPPPLPAAAPLPALTTCPQCLSPVTPDDVFCGVCGYRVK